MLFLSVLLLAGTGLLAPWVYPRIRHAAWFALVPAGVAVALGAATAALPPGGARVETLPWFAALGAGLDFRLDAFGGLMAQLAAGIGALVVVFASGYLHGHPALGRFLLHLFGFMAAMLGLVLADNVILLFVAWELTSLTSYLLIGTDHERAEARAKALQALLVTGAGGLALLAGLVLLAQAAGSWRLSEIVAAPALADAPTYPAFTLLILAGAFAKSAQVPFHFWLPNAMAAPTPVSAYLHSATMVKAGVFLLVRLSPGLDGTPLWHGSLLAAGSVTLLAGAALGIVQTDLKRILAYTTLSVLGTLTLLLGVGTELALQSLIVLLLGHALYKAALFMTAGAVDHGAGTRDLAQLGGLGRAMPFTAAAAGLAAFSSAGFPPFFGFIGKEYVYKTSAAAESLAPVLIGVALAANIVLLALALKAGWHPFWSPAPAGRALDAHEGSPALWAPPLALALVGLVLGLQPGWAAQHLVGPAVAALAREPVELQLALWHGFNLPLLLSGLTLAGGIAVYARRRHFWRKQERVEALPGPARAYEVGLKATIAFARRQTVALQSGALSRYVLIVIGATVALLVWKFLRFGGWPGAASFGRIELTPAVVCGLIMAGAVAAAAAHRRLSALLGLGLVGLGMALLFLYYGAPDLAITQTMVEALTVVLLLLVVDRLPAIRPERERGRLVRDGAVAAAFGGLVGLIALSATQLQVAPSIAPTLAAWSYPEAHGRNVVNVILVDFRALDTLGEIAVLAIAGLGVAALSGRPAGKGDAS